MISRYFIKNNENHTVYKYNLKINLNNMHIQTKLISTLSNGVFIRFQVQ